MERYTGVEPNARAYKKNVKVPEKGIKLFFFTLFSHFNKVLFANLLFILFSIPVVTLPAALTALSRVYIVLLNDGYVEVFKDFLREFKASFVNSLLLGICYAVIAGLALVCARVYPQMAGGMGTALFCVSCAVMVIASVVFSYAFPMNAQFKLKVRHILKNSVLMTIACPVNSLIIAAINVAFYLIAVNFFLQSIPLLLTVLISIYELAVYITVREPFKRFLMRAGQDNNA